MSSDDGYILRMNSAGNYVLQMYFASADEYPPIDDPSASVFNTMADALVTYNYLSTTDYPTEYGLTVNIDRPTLTAEEQRRHNLISSDHEKETQMIQTTKYARRPFSVDAVQVTAENMEEVAVWCGGEVRQEETTPGNVVSYVFVRVNRPLNERQTKAYINDWVLYAGTGYKSYTSKAFANSFQLEDTPQELALAPTVTNVFNNAPPADIGSPVKN